MAPQNGYGEITGHNIDSGIVEPVPIGFPNTPEGQRMSDDFYKKDPNEFDWNYMNTLEVQKFNKEGFHSNIPDDNIKIEGGVPDSLKKALRQSNCKEANLMSCAVQKYTGVMITAPSAKTLNDGKESIDTEFAKLDGSVKTVYADPSLVYTNKNPVSLRSVETLSGTIYI